MSSSFLRTLACGLLGMLFAWGGSAQAADKVTVAALRFVSSGPIFIAEQSGYFKDEGLDVDFRFFDAAQPVAVAIASGDADFGVTAFTAGFFNIASKGALQVVAGQLYEAKGVEGDAILASNKAWDGGLTTLAALPGHSFALTQAGSSFDYMIGLLAEKLDFPLARMRPQPLQSVGNMVGALRSGQVDSLIIAPHIAKPLVAAGDAHLLGWLSDSVQYQVGGLFTSTKNVTAHTDKVRRFVRAYQRGVHDYRAAFVHHDAAMQAKVVAMIHRYVYQDQSAPQAEPKIIEGAMYIPKDAALDAPSIYRQVAWYQARGLVGKDADPKKFVSDAFVPFIDGVQE